MTNTKPQIFNKRLHISERIIRNVTCVMTQICAMAAYNEHHDTFWCVTWICKSNKHVHKYLCTSMTAQTVGGWAYRAHVNQTTHRDWIIHENSRIIDTPPTPHQKKKKKKKHPSEASVVSIPSQGMFPLKPGSCEESSLEQPRDLRLAGQLAVIHTARSVRHRLASTPQAHADAGTHPMHA